ncbi:MAG: thiol oxidoreductase, partial [Candidatus Kapabacteria bacterium]|nr:thiol oxidoreductase [Candidatus Kapabacteria bacterium]
MMISRYSITAIALLGLALVAGCNGDSTTEPTPPSADDARSGGEMTIMNASSAAFSFPAPNLDGEAFNLHAEGDAAFEATFVTAPASVNAGLGPVYNNTSCISCHARDGRGRPPYSGENFSSMLFRISIPGTGSDGGPNPVPGFGGQLQNRSVFGVSAEGTISTTYIEQQGTFADGQSYTLRKPRYVVESSYRPTPAGMMISPRIAPPVVGLGLLEAVPESALLANADEADHDGDGISGRANYVWDVKEGKQAIGRFGW